MTTKTSEDFVLLDHNFAALIIISIFMKPKHVDFRKSREIGGSISQEAASEDGFSGGVKKFGKAG